ncbi:hypothetical protein RFI_36411 [Reticulomyxa filosa]|uniref:Uncharacterized protein n=1 Tax=Reticulomyxa filosa TaxID=46433 RepID=X6LHF2_RETFI|nr:hypothetical protein RFI_36411 [Reticulomyxa filosa]|eukprot:ETO01029.1 hypothetical protein RFI_36411 [Reticulomyxa filosa]
MAQILHKKLERKKIVIFHCCGITENWRDWHVKPLSCKFDLEEEKKNKSKLNKTYDVKLDLFFYFLFFGTQITVLMFEVISNTTNFFFLSKLVQGIKEIFQQIL